MKEFFEHAQGIITAASNSPLGIIALIILAFAVLGYILFKNEDAKFKLFALAILLVGLLSYSYALFSNISHLSNVDRVGEVDLTIAKTDPIVDPTIAKTDPIKEIVVGGKIFLESNILLELMAILIENEYPQLKVKRNYNVGNTLVVFNALKDRKIHLYAEYSGTLLARNLGLSNEEILHEAYHKTRKINEIMNSKLPDKKLEWLDHFGFSNSYVLIMLKEKLKELNIDKNEPTISNLKKHANKILRIRVTPDFFFKPDGIMGIKKVYGLFFASEDVMRHDLKYEELLNKNIDITDGYSTDPPINRDENPFVQIIDDKKFFPKYYAGPLVDQNVLKDFPKIRTGLGKLAGKISAKEMAILIDQCTKELNKLEDKALRTSKQAQGILYDNAKDFLSKKGILD